MNEKTQDSLPPDGWRAHSLPGFFGMVGPLLSRREGDGWSYGFQVGPQHLNAAGIVHGGMISTLIDQALSAIAWDAAGRIPCVTVQLDTHFLAAGQPGQTIVVRGRISKKTGTLMFMQAEVHAAEQMIATANAIMKLVRPA